MSFERRAWWIGRILAVLLIVVSLRAAYWQLIRGLRLDPVATDPVAAARYYADLRGEPTPNPAAPEAASLAQLPQPVVQRTVQMLSRIQRGRIYDRNGVVLAEDVGNPGSYTRVYSDPSLAHMVGYSSTLRTGIMGLEATYNRSLLGLDRPDTEIDRMLHRPIQGSSLVLTVDSNLQRAAAQALGGRPGTIIVLDAPSGAVLAMTSAPLFDPNAINNAEYAASLQGTTAMLNRATQALYTPGSTYKTVTMIAGLESRAITPRTIFDFGQPQIDSSGRPTYTYMVDGGLIYDRNHTENRLDLRMSFVYSANVAFAKVAHDMDTDDFIAAARRFGYSDPDYTRRFPLELPVALPQLANDVESIRTNNLLRAHTGYGQGELLTTPINMAVMMQAVVNGGSVPVPYMVESVRDPEGGVIRNRPNRHTARGLMRRDTAEFTRESMIALANHYWKDPNYLPGIVWGGKTGTAEVGDELTPHAWFSGFAQKGERQVVIVVVLENAGSGGQLAVPIFREVALAALP
jgi:peptidoglycan glycosyltransferase